MSYADAKISISNPDTEMVDVMGGGARWEVKIHEHGFVALVDVMPRLVPDGGSADAAIVQAARVSYGNGTKKVSEDRGLIRYLMRQRHTSPFEMCVTKWHCSMPIFIARQWVRHRTASMNEISARYSVLPAVFYRPTPDSLRQQSTTNKQGGNGQVEEMTAEEFYRYLDNAEARYAEYEALAGKGVARELARIGLPLSIYTEFYWRIDLHNLFHFLSLRMDKHAQQEIRDYANPMFAMIQAIAPIAAEAFLDYNLNSMRLSSLEIEAIRSGNPIASDNSREQAEWDAKRKVLSPGDEEKSCS